MLSIQWSKQDHSAEKVLASICWESQGVIMIDYFEHGRMIYCKRIEVAMPGNCKKEARKTDMRYSALAGRSLCLLVTSCHDYCD